MIGECDECGKEDNLFLYFPSKHPDIFVWDDICISCMNKRDFEVLKQVVREVQ